MNWEINLKMRKEPVFDPFLIFLFIYTSNPKYLTALL